MLVCKEREKQVRNVNNGRVYVFSWMTEMFQNELKLRATIFFLNNKIST